MFSDDDVHATLQMDTFNHQFNCQNLSSADRHQSLFIPHIPNMLTESGLVCVCVCVCVCVLQRLKVAESPENELQALRSLQEQQVTTE